MLLMHVHKGVHQHEHMHGTPDVSFALHRSIICADVEKYGGRANPDQLAVRAALFRALETAFAGSRVPAEHVAYEDRGDGALILVDPAVPKEHLAGAFPARLAACLERHNGHAPPGARIRLRVAVHAGEVHYDGHGVAGTAINVPFRLVEAGPLTEALRNSPSVLALIASEWFYDEVIAQNRTCEAAAYRRVRVTVKETRTHGWVRVLPAAPAQLGRRLRPVG
jgi:class 3 adenylate cyclase